MTTASASQFGQIVVVASIATPIEASQLGIISVQQDAPASSPSNASQLGIITVIANGHLYQPLGPVIGLGCWSPCGMLAHRFNV